MNGLVEMFAISFAFIAMLTAIAALSMVIGMKLSTHNIVWKPLETDSLIPKEQEEIESEEDSELLNKALELQRKKKRQEDPLDAIAETSNF